MAAENAAKYKVLKSNYSIGKANCTKAMKKLEQTFDDYNKNKGTEVQVTKRMRIAAELVEQVELSKNKLKELTNLVDSFIAIITDLEDEYFTNPDKETLLTTIQKEQETYDEKYDEFMKTNEEVILEGSPAGECPPGNKCK